MDEKEYAEALIRTATELGTTEKNSYGSDAGSVRTLVAHAQLIVDRAIELAAARAAKSK
jgi:hypothetical protein